MNPKRFRSVFWVLGILIALALLRDVLANGRPLYCRIGGTAYFPGLRTIFVDPDLPYNQPALRNLQLQPQSFEAWKTASNYDEPPFYAPIPFSPGEYSLQNPEGFKRPGWVHAGLSARFRHWMGTDAEGRDVAAGLVSGARVALLVGMLSMLIAGVIGLILGALAGFWGDDRLRVSISGLIINLAGIPFAFFYAFTARQYELDTSESLAQWGFSGLIFVGVALLFYGIGKLVQKLLPARSVTLPVDLLVMRLTEIFNAIPKLIFILIVAALLPKNQNIWVMIALIGLLNWTDLALFVRAELLRVRELDFVTAARGLGFSNLRIFRRHAFPNALRPALVIFAFNIAGAILMESALSFLGFGGTSLRGISWGSLLDSVRTTPSAWWIAIPPGMAIAFTILTINKIGELLSDVRG